MNVDWGFSWAVVLVGLVVVFAVLLILVLFCSGLGKMFTSMDKKSKGEPKSKSAPVASNKPQGGTATLDMMHVGICDDVVAAITAAIAVMMSEEGVSKPFAIKSIKREKNARSIWNFAGINDNTRPF